MRHLCRRGAALDIMNRKHGLQGEAGIDVFLELGTELAKFFEREILKLTALCQTMLDGVADALVSQAEWHSMPNQVCGRGPRIQKTGLGGVLHARIIELRRFHPSRNQRKKREQTFSGVEQWFLRLLKVLVVGQGQAFEHGYQGGEITNGSSDFCPGQLQQVWILLLRHGAAAG